MPKKNPDEYILGSEAAAIMTRNSGHDISPGYVRLLAGNTKKGGKIRSRMRDGRTREYHRGDVEGYRVEKKNPAVPDESEPLARVG